MMLQMFYAPVVKRCTGGCSRASLASKRLNSSCNLSERNWGTTKENLNNETISVR